MAIAVDPGAPHAPKLEMALEKWAARREAMHMTQDGDNVILRKSDEVVVFFGCVLHKVKRGIDLCTTPEKAKKKRG